MTLAVAITLSASPMKATADGTCGFNEAHTTGCPTVTGSIGPTDVTLTGTENPRDTLPHGSPHEPTAIDECDDPSSVTCLRPYIARVTAPVTLADIAAFRPATPVDRMEPNGWTVVGLDTNFYATGSAHVVSGTLLGQPADVRFTPVQWHWSYGDGEAAIHPYPGSTWAAQGVHEFDPTGTSHVYRQLGSYVIDLDVDFAAEYRYAGGPWVTIAGALTVPASRLSITVGDAKTVLVARDCARNPGGPGC